MRILIRVAVVLALLFVAGLAALAVYLPRIVQSDAVRERIETAAQDALGREVAYEGLEVGLLPPSLVVVAPRVAGKTPASEPMLEADRVSLRVALAPLLVRAVVIDSLVVQGATVRLTRTADGIELPTPSRTPGAAPSGEAPVDLAVRSVSLRDSAVVLDDRAVTPAVTWDLRDLDATARGSALDEPFGFDVSFRLADGGRFRGDGKITPSGPIDAKLEFDAFPLDRLRPYLPGRERLAGLATGTVTVSGPPANPDVLVAKLVVDDADVTQGDVALAGKVAADVDVRGGFDAPKGRFAIDAKGADVRYGDSFHKAPGVAAAAVGTVATSAGGAVEIHLTDLSLHDLSADGDVALGDRTRVVLNARPFDLAGWESIVPALAEYGLSGPVRIDGLELATEPLDVRGTVTLDGVTSRRSGQSVRVNGAVVGEGGAVRTRDLAVTAAGQTLKLVAAVTNLAATPSYRVDFETAAADANALTTAFAGKPDFLFGLLHLKGDLAGPLAGDAARGARGALDFGIGTGRMAGISPLQLTFGKLAGAAGGGLLAASSIFLVPDLQRFYGDQFDSMGATFQVRDGVARTNDFRLAYPHYAVELAGALPLANGQLDMRGKLTIDEEIDAVLQKAIHRTTKLAEATPRARTIPLVHVRGTLAEPQYAPDPGVVASLLGGQLENKLGGILGEALGLPSAGAPATGSASAPGSGEAAPPRSILDPQSILNPGSILQPAPGATPDSAPVPPPLWEMLGGKKKKK